MKLRIAMVANTAWYIANFRLRLAQALRAEGYEVIVIAPPDKHVDRIKSAGFRFIPLLMDNKGSNPIRDLGLFFKLLALLRRERPAVYLGYTVKPNVYGGLACRFLSIPSVHNVAGLGMPFIKSNWLTRVVEVLYRAGLRRASMVFFQNREDLGQFTLGRLVPIERVDLLPGSGVDIEKFSPDLSIVHNDHPFRFLLSGRLLWDKGVGEFVEAARKLRDKGVETEFQLLGFLDVQNRTAISRRDVEAWEQEGIVRYLGTADDVRPFIGKSDCVVLPSYYREGVPRSLLEAASMAKPIITTDSVGCRDVVEDGVTGYLCRVRDSTDLADKMMRMLDLSEKHRINMGRLGREKMMREFDERIVIEKYLKVIGEIAKRSESVLV